jgi:hypothetical protein
LPLAEISFKNSLAARLTGRCLGQTATIFRSGFGPTNEVLVTTILDNNQRAVRAKKIDRYCRIIIPVIFVIASIAIFAHPRA